MSARISSISVALATARRGTGAYRRVGMTRPGRNRASERARRLASLSAALDEAQGVLTALDGEAAQSAEAHHLRSRIAAIRSEVEQLRRGGFPGLKEVGKKSPAGAKWPDWNR